MTGIKVDIVTPERIIYSGEADAIIAHGVEGELGILPHHAPLITLLQPGELTLRKGEEEVCMAIYGGFLEVRPDRVIVLADAAQRSEEIDVSRAEAAKRWAEQHLADRNSSEVDRAQAEAALRQALASLKVVEKEKRRKRPKI
jgi:F-type H+-transporting ATPase subunit epsilon